MHLYDAIFSFERLSHEAPGTAIPYVMTNFRKLTKVHTFPPKSLRKNKEFVAGRTEKLNDYFAAIGKEERISSDHRLLKYFLGICSTFLLLIR